MMVQEKLIALIETLAEKSKAGTLDWEAAAGSDSYQTIFPHHTVEISEFSAGGSAEYILTIRNEEGEVMEIVLGSHFPTEVYQLLKTVFNGARRKVMELDSALDEILSSLQS